jgi:ABC-type nitrate/sulfonate/bicarbonate transport system substrate-binding protein
MSADLEIRELCLGVMSLVEAAPFFVAQEKGFFAKQGLDVDIRIESSWAGIRDRLATGMLDGAQMQAPMPIAATLGIDGIGVPMVTAMTLNLNGGAVGVSESIWRELRPRRREPLSTGRALASMLIRDRLLGRSRRVFAHPFPFSSHNYLLRYWLAACDIDPERDLSLEVIPSSMLAQHLGDGRIDGFCVSAPYAGVAEAESCGYRLVNNYQIWNNAPGTVLGVTAAWGRAHPRTHRALVAALLDACRWLDAADNRMEGAQILIDSEAIDGSPANIRAALEVPPPGDGFNGTGLVFHRHAANFPWVSQAMWFIEQMRRWNQVDGDINPATIAAATCSTKVYREAAARIGAISPRHDHKTEGLHPGIWTLPLLSGPLKMGPDAFFDGAIYGTDGMRLEKTA